MKWHDCVDVTRLIFFLIITYKGIYETANISREEAKCVTNFIFGPYEPYFKTDFMKYSFLDKMEIVWLKYNKSLLLFNIL